MISTTCWNYLIPFKCWKLLLDYNLLKHFSTSFIDCVFSLCLYLEQRWKSSIHLHIVLWTTMLMKNDWHFQRMHTRQFIAWSLCSICLACNSKNSYKFSNELRIKGISIDTVTTNSIVYIHWRQSQCACVHSKTCANKLLKCVHMFRHQSNESSNEFRGRSNSKWWLNGKQNWSVGRWIITQLRGVYNELMRLVRFCWWQKLSVTGIYHSCDLKRHFPKLLLHSLSKDRLYFCIRLVYVLFRLSEKILQRHKYLKTNIRWWTNIHSASSTWHSTTNATIASISFVIAVLLPLLKSGSLSHYLQWTELAFS